MPSTTSSSPDFSTSSGKQATEDEKESNVGSPNGLGEGEQEEKKKQEERDDIEPRREQRMQIVWDPPIVKSLFVAQALYTG